MSLLKKKYVYGQKNSENELGDTIEGQDVKIARKLISETEDRLNSTLMVPMACKFQLRDDIASVERCIAKIKPGKSDPKKIEALTLATIRLKTTSENILQWEFNPLGESK